MSRVFITAYGKKLCAGLSRGHGLEPKREELELGLRNGESEEGGTGERMAVTRGAAALAATLAAAAAAAIFWWCGSGNWLLLTPQHRKGAPSSSGVSPWRWAFRLWISTTSQGSATAARGCVKSGLLGLIGSTPLVRIQSLSDATGCEILGKAEFLNPGGSVKDRVAVRIIEEALESGALRVGGLITEGSAGSTGISLAMVASVFGCRCHVAIPDDAAVEKGQLLEALGAIVERVQPVSITHKDHFVNIARRRAQDANMSTTQTSSKISELAALKEAEIPGDIVNVAQHENGIKGGEVPGSEGLEKEEKLSKQKNHGGGFFADQFENLANFRAHYEGTGPEIWKQTGGALHAFVAAAGTGGTVAGVSCFLKEQNSNVKCYLIDPPGSGLFNRVTRGVMYTWEEAEGKRLKNPLDTITEGIGINRLTENFKLAQLDGAFRGTDREAVEMSRFLLRKDGLFIGSSSAMNCVGAVRVARLLGPGHTIVTILCDSGTRHLSKFQNPDYLASHGLTPSASELEFING